MKNTLGIMVLAMALLNGCGELKNQFDTGFRNEFISKCVDKIAKSGGSSAEKRQEYCTCSADNTLAELSAGDITKLVGGQVDETLSNKIQEAIKPCLTTLE